MATWCRPIATLAYRCSKVSSFTFVVCFVSKVMPYFTSIVLCLLISDALIEFNLFDPSRCSIVTFYRLHSNLGSTVAYEIPNWAKLWYRTVWNIIYTVLFQYRYTAHPYYKHNLFSTLSTHDFLAKVKLTACLNRLFCTCPSHSAPVCARIACVLLASWVFLHYMSGFGI